MDPFPRQPHKPPAKDALTWLRPKGAGGRKPMFIQLPASWMDGWMRGEVTCVHSVVMLVTNLKKEDSLPCNLRSLESRTAGVMWDEPKGGGRRGPIPVGN